MIFALGPGILALISSGNFIYNYFNKLHLIIIILGTLLIFFFGFLLFTWIFRLCIPEMKPGIYKMGLSKE
jgi:hypothetical protein